MEVENTLHSETLVVDLTYDLKHSLILTFYDIAVYMCIPIYTNVTKFSPI